MEDGKGNVRMDPDMDDDSDDEVSLLVVDEDELNTTLNEAGIQVKVDAEGSSVEVSVLSEDVSTFLMFAPEEEYLGAKVTGFVPREDGGLSALEMHGQLLEGDVLTHLNGSNARLLDFTDILKACRGPDRGGLPRPLVMKFSRSEALSPPASPAPSPPASPTAERGQAAAVTSKTDAAGGGASGGGGATSGASSLLADLDDFMGGLSLPGGEARIPGMSHIKGVLRAELQAQGMLGGSGDGGDAGGNAGGSGNSGDPSPPGEGLFLNMLRRLENVDVAGEDSPRVAAAAADGAANGFNGDESRGGGGDGAEVAARGTYVQEVATPGGGGVGSSFAGVGAKLRSKFRKPGRGFGLPQGVGGRGGGGGGGDQTVGGATEGVGEGGKAFVEGASKALAVNRERMMGWMKELRPKDWSLKEAERTVEEESIQELRRAVRRLYLDAPDPAIHTAMVVARARPSAPKSAAAAAEEEAKGPTAEAAAVGEVAGTPKEAGAVDRVIGTGADKRLTKLVWFRSSSGGGFAEIKGVEGPYYQPSADDLGSRICIKCTLAGTALNFGGTGGGGVLSPTNRGKGRRGRHGRGGGRSGSRSPQRQQDQISFAEVGPIVLDSKVGAEVDKLLSADGPAVFRGLVRRDTPGETGLVRVEVGREQIRVVAEPGDAAAAAADGNSPGAEPPGVTVETVAAAAASVQPPDAVTEGSPEAALATGSGEKDDGATAEEAGAGGEVAAAADGGKPSPLVAAAASSQDGAEATAVVVLAEGRYSSGVLVTLEPARPTVLRLTVGRGQGGEAAAAVGVSQAPTPPALALLLGAVDGIQRDVLALTLRGRRQAALGPGVTVDDYPEETKAHQAHEDYLELKAAAANFASAYDEDGTSATSRSGSSAEDDDDHDDDHEEPDSGSYYDTSEEDDGEEADTDTGEESAADGETGRGGSHRGGGGGGGARRASWKGGGSGSGTLARAASRGSLPAAATAGAGGGAGAGPQGGVGGVADAAPWEAAGSGGEGEKGAGGEPRSLTDLLEDLRQARAIADSRGRQLKEAHSMWEAGEASRQKAEAELNLVSSELDLLRPFSKSLAARAEGKEAAEEAAGNLASEVETLREQLAAAVESAERLGSRAGTAEDEAGASASKLSGLEKVVRRLGGEAEVAHSELAKERAGVEEAVARASKAERELDQARARAAVLDNKLATLEKDKLELLADANSSRARASALEEKYSAARAAEAAESEARVSELEGKVSSLESENLEAVARMEEALSKEAAAEEMADKAVKMEEDTRTEMAGKTEEVMRLTAQRNSAKSRADSLAKDLSRVCGGGRTLDQIEAIVTKYADLKVKMATMEAEKDGAADLVDEWQSNSKGERGEGGRKVSEAAKRALRENTELHGRVAAMTESLQMRAHQLEGQRQSNEFLLKRVEELEQQVATTSGKTAIGTD